MGRPSKLRHASRRFSVSQPGSPFSDERAFTVSSLMPLLFKTSGTPFALMYHLSSKKGGPPKREPAPPNCSAYYKSRRLADGAFHLKLDQAVKLDRVLQRK